MQPHQPNFQFEVRAGTKSDLAAVAALFAAHYAWDLTSRDAGQAERLQKELAGVACGGTLLAVAEARGEIIGAALAVLDRDFAKYEPVPGRKTGYLSKNVVHEDFRGLGVGKMLVGARLQALRALGVQVVYSSHHADNVGSAKALDAFGFEYVESYFDPEKRPTGSQRTTVRRVLV
jgi:L-amino acid N-acyltransferase YncA